MVIWIDLPLDELERLSENTIEALIELGEAGYRGRHAVVGARTVLGALAKLERLSPRAKTYYRRVTEEYTQLRSILGHSRKIVASSMAVAPINRGGIWYVPLDVFSQSNYVEPSAIVCENDLDYEVYSIFADVMARKHFPGAVLCSQSLPGGGGGAATVLLRKLADPNPMILCILDSDRTIFRGREGDTARGCRNVWQDSWRSQLIVLVSRELENAVPVAMIGHWARSAGEDDAAVARFELIDKNLTSYVCLKSGEKLCRFYTISKDAEGYAVTIRALAETARQHPGYLKCYGDVDNCDCFKCPQLGDRFLKRFLDWIKDYGNRKFFPALDLWAQDMFEAVSLFVDYSLALPRKQ